MEDADLFIEAQDSVWPNVIAELTSGQKTSHWMWFVFPQLASLGKSNTAQLFGLHDLDEATDYLADPVLGPRLVQVSDLLLQHAGTPPQDILGKVDALKLRSSMTLFAAVPGADPVFSKVLDAFYDGAQCPQTLTQVAGSGS